MEEEREQLEKANETIASLRDEVKSLYTKLDNYNHELAVERSIWERFADSIILSNSFADFIETMVSDEVDSKIDNLDLSDEISDEVDSYLSASTITIDRY
jgi:hypothetical protein